MYNNISNKKYLKKKVDTIKLLICLLSVSGQKCRASFADEFCRKTLKKTTHCTTHKSCRECYDDELYHA